MVRTGWGWADLMTVQQIHNNNDNNIRECIELGMGITFCIVLQCSLLVLHRQALFFYFSSSSSYRVPSEKACRHNKKWALPHLVEIMMCDDIQRTLVDDSIVLQRYSVSNKMHIHSVFQSCRRFVGRERIRGARAENQIMGVDILNRQERWICLVHANVLREVPLLHHNERFINRRGARALRVSLLYSTCPPWRFFQVAVALCPSNYSYSDCMCFCSSLAEQGLGGE